VRTTRSIDDDLMALLRAEAHRQRVPLRLVVNAALRKALTHASRRKSPPVLKTSGSTLRAGFDPAGFNQLTDNLEDEGFVKVLGRR
jgi:hypothetical protein